MSFQWIIDNASSISINRKKIVSSTTARDGTTRAVSRGGQVWTFDVRLPDGIRWTDLRKLISQAEALDRVSTATINFNHLGHEWIAEYQGGSPSPNTFTASWSQGASTITVSGGGTITEGYKFRAGDFIQLGSSGKVYTVAADVAYNASAVSLHRPILDNSGTNASIRVGTQSEWTVLCTQFPEWTLFARDQVSWSGSFVFVENLV